MSRIHNILTVIGFMSFLLIVSMFAYPVVIETLDFVGEIIIYFVGMFA